MTEHESDFRRQPVVQRGLSVGMTVLIVAVLVIVVIIGAVGLVGAGWWAVSHGTFGLRKGPSALLRIGNGPTAGLVRSDNALEGPAAERYRQQMDLTIKSHLVRLQTDEVARRVLRDPAVMQTQWYGRFDDPGRRAENFRRRAVAERYRDSLLVGLHFDGVKPTDAATIANAWARSYLDLLHLEQREQLDEQARAIQQQHNELTRRIATLTHEHDALEDRQSAQALRLRHELESQLERANELERRLDELQLQRQHRPPVTLQQPAAPTSSSGPTGIP